MKHGIAICSFRTPFVYRQGNLRLYNTAVSGTASAKASSRWTPFNMPLPARSRRWFHLSLGVDISSSCFGLSDLHALFCFSNDNQCCVTAFRRMFFSLTGLIGPLFQTHVVRPVGLTILRFLYFLYSSLTPSFILGRGAAESHRSRSHRWGCQITFLIRKPFPMRFYWRPKSFRSISLCCPCVGTRRLVRPLNKSNSLLQSTPVKASKALPGGSG